MKRLEDWMRRLVVFLAVILAAIVVFYGAQRIWEGRRGPGLRAAVRAKARPTTYLHPPAPAPDSSGAPGDFRGAPGEARGPEAVASIPAIAISRTGRPTVRTTAPPSPRSPSE